MKNSRVSAVPMIFTDIEDHRQYAHITSILLFIKKNIEHNKNIKQFHINDFSSFYVMFSILKLYSLPVFLVVFTLIGSFPLITL